jgi:hypothetical protein
MASMMRIIQIGFAKMLVPVVDPLAAYARKSIVSPPFFD